MFPWRLLEDGYVVLNVGARILYGIIVIDANNADGRVRATNCHCPKQLTRLSLLPPTPTLGYSSEQTW
jgi:hypothetical protein